MATFLGGFEHSTIAAAVFLVGLGYAVAVGFYRLLLHPLTGIPGPKIAALTGWYEFYWQCPKKGHYIFRVQEMHQEYGPIVRINPWEVHIDDPAFFETFYSNNKLDKHAWFYRAFGDNGAAVGTSHWETHKARRGAMAKFFSTANVSKLEPLVEKKVQQLLDRVEEHRQTARAIDISNAYRCYATDVISTYAAPHSRNLLATPDFAAAFNKALGDFSRIMLWHRHIPIVFPVMNAIPRSVIASMDSRGANVAIIDNQADLWRQARAVVERRGVTPDGQTPTVLDAIYTSPLIGQEDKTLDRLLAETQAILGAGTETTGNTLSNFTYNVVSQPSVLKRLKDELQQTALSSGPGLIPTKTLEHLPYLQSCIREALRLATGVSSRLPRVNRFAPTLYTTPSGIEHVFPPGTVISMSILDLHYNGDIFTDPTVFRPERWLDTNAEKRGQMERCFAPFGRGVRQCVGLELAKSEITLMLGNLFARFDFELFETTERDVSICHDYFAPFGPDDSKGVRVVAK